MSSTEKQIAANRENAQLSTGPVTEAGAERSSRNATKHGFTGQSIVVSEAEGASYEAHVEAYSFKYLPANHQEKQLVQLLADHDWSLQQIGVQQINTIAQMNTATTIMSAAGDPVATAAILSSLSKTLNTLGIYEARRGRAAKAIHEELEAVQKAAAELLRQELPQAATLYKIHKAKGQDWDPSEFGFLCSLEDVYAYLRGQELAQDARNLQNPGGNGPSL
jgi:hypothetical protein